MNNMNLGVDIVLVDRINKILNSKKKSRFLNKIFSRSEISDSKNRQNQSEYLSGRFAAKEAIKKALSSYDETGMPSFKSLEILNSESGKPYVLINSKKQSNINISIAHDGNYAIAFCVANLD
ncbi:MAG: holo-[acyl-carrier-protein] synthase [Candidatus Neomarinimicrobiota bacterium]|jgi:holo-[acyl-carrier protein] synthase|nr:MAG: holo-[acyl-carrier-protein] synthase [Candidatus Neomarinimicrobiota bacterium]GIT65689.1 MAG: holo-[acyl-carrier-protein] synthase [Candidatus Neomarinimicrobiota bacterium]|tara:strand:+ start:167 stop:532 length:366 start_codon:yes stop_codon:yes gene_type:complete